VAALLPPDDQIAGLPRSLKGLDDQLKLLEWLVATPTVLTVTLADHIPQPSRDALKQQCLTWGVAWQLQGPRGNQAAVLGLRGTPGVSRFVTSLYRTEERLRGVLYVLLANVDLAAITLPADLYPTLQPLCQAHRLGTRQDGGLEIVTVFRGTKAVPGGLQTAHTVEEPTIIMPPTELMPDEDPDVILSAIMRVGPEVLQTGRPIVVQPFRGGKNEAAAVETWAPVAAERRLMMCLLRTPDSLLLHLAERVKRIFHCATLPLALPPAVLAHLQACTPQCEDLAPEPMERKQWSYSLPPDNAVYDVDEGLRGTHAEERLRLPINNHRDVVLQSVANHRVTILDGPTGSGKTTQVPQYIADCPGLLEPGHPVILVTQPRRIAAINAAIRVAQERGQSVGQEVGYLVRFETAMSANTRIVFLTSGVLLRRLQDDPSLRGVGCVIIDEVHERSLEIDFCLLIMKQLFLANQLSAKLVVMSATLQAGTFVDYFSSVTGTTSKGEVDAPNHVHVEGRMFPVQSFYLEEALRWTGFRVDRKTGLAYDAYEPPLECRPLLRSIVDPASSTPEALQAELQKLEAATEALRRTPPHTFCLNAPVELMMAVIVTLHETGVSGGILAFLPGLRDIDNLQRELEGLRTAGELFIIPVHSMLPRQHQQALFQPPPPGRRKVVLATNIAESSITVDDVVFVVDSGLMKGMQYDRNRHISSLDNLPVSKANVLQRRGRAGRVQPGIAIHLFARTAFDKLEPSPTPELLQVPLEEVCLRVQALGKEDVHRFLAMAVDGPDRLNVENALSHLQRIGAIGNDLKLNGLGRLLAAMPLPPKLGKLLVAGAMFGVLSPIAVVAAFCASRSPFVASMDPGTADRLRRRRQSMFHDVRYPASDYIVLLRIFKEWAVSYDPWGFCRNYGVHQSTMHEVRNTARQYIQCFQEEMKFEASPVYDRHASNERLTSAVVALCLYPSVVVYQGQWNFPYDVLPVAISRDSMLFQEKENLPTLMTFFEHLALEGRARVGINGDMPPLAMALSCQHLEIVRRWQRPDAAPVPASAEREGPRPLLGCDNWLFLEAQDDATVRTVFAVRGALAAHLHRFAASRRADALPLEFLDAVASAVNGGEDLGGPVEASFTGPWEGPGGPVQEAAPFPEIPDPLANAEAPNWPLGDEGKPDGVEPEVSEDISEPLKPFVAPADAAQAGEHPDP
jgi:HrpA-like RNA helicase